MDVMDQLGAYREGKLSRRRFLASLSAVGIGMTAMPLTSRKALAAGEQGTYFTWGGYDIPELFAEYVEKNGEMPNFSIFGGAEEALTKMRGGFVVDVSHPCNADIPRWASTGLFQPIDTNRLQHWNDVIPDLHGFDYNQANGGVWMVPFEWGQTSITYRTDLVELDGEESWGLLWDERYAGKIGSLGSGGDAWWCAAIKAGIDFNDIASDAAFDKVASALRTQRPLMRVYTDDTTTLEQALASGEIVAAMTWNSSAVALAAEGVPVKFATPKEGALTWVCGMMVHKDAPNLDRAYDIIDSLLSVPTGEFIINDYGYGHSNARAFDAFDDATLAGLGLSKNPGDILNAGHFMIPQEQDWESRMNETFEQIKAGF